jgi:hypothetical protein
MRFFYFFINVSKEAEADDTTGVGAIATPPIMNDQTSTEHRSAPEFLNFRGATYV